MFSKKMLIWTLVSIIFSLTYEKLLALPPERYRPLILLVLLVAIVARYLYDKGYFTEEKIVETIIHHQEEGLDRIHTSSETIKEDGEHIEKI